MMLQTMNLPYSYNFHTLFFHVTAGDCNRRFILNSLLQHPNTQSDRQIRTRHH